MQFKRKKRTRIRAAKKTAGHGSKKKHRGSGHRGGVGFSSIGKRGSAKLMKITKGEKYLGKEGFKSIKKQSKPVKAINLNELQAKLNTLLKEGKITKENDKYVIDLSVLGYQKLLAKGDVKEKMKIKVDFVSSGAEEKVKKAGGEIIREQNNNSEIRQDTK